MLYNGILYSVPLTLIFKYCAGAAGKPLAEPSEPTVVSSVAPIISGFSICTLPVPFVVIEINKIRIKYFLFNVLAYDLLQKLYFDVYIVFYLCETKIVYYFY